MSEQKKFPQRVKNAMDNAKLRISAPCPTPSGKGKFSLLTWQVVNGNPRIVVNTNDPEDKHDFGRITAKADIIIFGIIIEAIRRMSKAERGEKIIINCQDYTFFGGKRSEQPEITASVYVGKDAEGYTYISVLDTIRKERPKIKFQFKPPRFVELMDKNGQPVDVETASSLVATAYADVLSFYANELSIDTWVEPQTSKQNKFGGNKGNYNNNRQQESTSSSNDFGDDDFGDDLNF